MSLFNKICTYGLNSFSHVLLRCLPVKAETWRWTALFTHETGWEDIIMHTPVRNWRWARKTICTKISTRQTKRLRSHVLQKSYGARIRLLTIPGKTAVGHKISTKNIQDMNILLFQRSCISWHAVPWHGARRQCRMARHWQLYLGCAWTASFNLGEQRAVACVYRLHMDHPCQQVTGAVMSSPHGT